MMDTDETGEKCVVGLHHVRAREHGTGVQVDDVHERCGSNPYSHAHPLLSGCVRLHASRIAQAGSWRGPPTCILHRGRAACFAWECVRFFGSRTWMLQITGVYYTPLRAVSRTEFSLAVSDGMSNPDAGWDVRYGMRDASAT